MHNILLTKYEIDLGMVKVNFKERIAQRKIGIEFVLHDVMVQHFATIARWGDAVHKSSLFAWGKYDRLHNHETPYMWA